LILVVAKRCPQEFPPTGVGGLLRPRDQLTTGSSGRRKAPPLNRGLSEIGKLEELVTAIEEELELGTLVT
jgi:hypothetical protein